jgi:hypothetical protein
MSVAKKIIKVMMKANGETADYMAKLWIQPVLMLFLWVTLLQM